MYACSGREERDSMSLSYTAPAQVPDSPTFTPDNVGKSSETSQMSALVGFWNTDRSLSILGRADSLLQPMKGQVVFASALECAYLECNFVSQIFITCKKYRPLVAVVVPDRQSVTWWASKHNLSHTPHMEVLCRNPELRRIILQQLMRVSVWLELKSFEFIEALYLEPEMFTVKNEGLTPGLSLRRQVLEAQYVNEIECMYRDLPGAPDSNSLTVSEEPSLDGPVTGLSLSESVEAGSVEERYLLDDGEDTGSLFQLAGFRHKPVTLP